MAENAANFLATSQNEPSIFEIIAQKSLNDTLYPALQKLSLFLSTNFPRKFNWLNKYYDEAFLLLNLGLQYGYLKRYDATFSENFYGMKRILLNNKSLSDHHKRISCIFIVLLPYFKHKIDERVALYRLEQADGCLRNNFEGYIKSYMILFHSTFETIWGIATIIYYIKYMANEVESQLPILGLIKIKLAYAEPTNNEVGLWAKLLKGQFRNLLFADVLKTIVTTSFEMGAFFLQFLQAWRNQANYSLTSLPNVPAPKTDPKATTYVNKCPICLQYWKIPTVLPVSGYVFCFPCILRYLRENQKCPVTCLPAKPLDIVRLYDNE